MFTSAQTVATPSWANRHIHEMWFYRNWACGLNVPSFVCGVWAVRRCFSEVTDTTIPNKGDGAVAASDWVVSGSTVVVNRDWRNWVSAFWQFITYVWMEFLLRLEKHVRRDSDMSFLTYHLPVMLHIVTHGQSGWGWFLVDFLFWIVFMVTRVCVDFFP